MKRKIFLYNATIYFLLIFSGCMSRSEKSIEEYFDSNGNLLKTEESMKDNVVAITEYEKNGDIKRKYLVDSVGKIHGEMYVYKNNVLLKTHWYKKGVLDGVGYQFYENGNKEYKYFFNKGERYGDVYYFDEETEKLKNYSSYNINDSSAFFRSYDQDGNVVSQGGEILHSIFIYEQLPIMKGEKIHGELIFATPPKCSTSVSLIGYKRDNDVIMRDKKVYLKSHGYSAKFSVLAEQPQSMIFEAEMYDSLTNEIHRDTLFFTYNIKEFDS